MMYFLVCMCVSTSVQVSVGVYIQKSKFNLGCFPLILSNFLKKIYFDFICISDCLLVCMISMCVPNICGG